MEIFESLRVPYGPYFVRADVWKASKRLEGWNEEFHKRLVESVHRLRSSGFPVYLGFVISDEVNVLLGEVFSRRVEKVVSLVASFVSLSVSMPVDARIVYTPSLNAAWEYLKRRQALGSNNAIRKTAYMEALKKGLNRQEAHRYSSRPLDELWKEFSWKLPKWALRGTLILGDETLSESLESVRKNVIQYLLKQPLQWSEKLVRSRA